MLPIKDFNYPLSEEQIAKYPISPRDHSKLLLYKGGEISHDIFHNIGRHIKDTSLLVYNNTRVIQARLIFQKATGARIELFCLEPLLPREYTLSLSSTEGCEWECLVGNSKKWKNDPLALYIASIGVTLTATRIESLEFSQRIRFTWDNPQISFGELLDAIGELPIPPYLNRPTEDSDKENYQTVYSRIQGSVAAPTAGLHFTEDVLSAIRNKNVDIETVCLHVGAGTFLPVKSSLVSEHTMHREPFVVTLDFLRKLKSKLGRVIAVGTTSVRTLESLYYIGVSCIENGHPEDVGQWAPYQREYQYSVAESLEALVEYMSANGMNNIQIGTKIIIVPGYTFRIVDVLVTNFHQPQSTLLLLISAFVKGDWRNIYDHALQNDFRFLSYGDSSLLFRR